MNATTANKSLVITWSERHPDAQIVYVIGETEKALRIKNSDSGLVAWIPKSGLKKYVPPKICQRIVGDDEFTVAPWFREKCTMTQMRALGYAE